MNIRTYWKHMGFLMKTVISDVFISLLRSLISFVDVHHRASPDVKIYKAYGLFYIDIFQKKELDRNSTKHL